MVSPQTNKSTTKQKQQHPKSNQKLVWTGMGKKKTKTQMPINQQPQSTVSSSQVQAPHWWWLAPRLVGKLLNPPTLFLNESTHSPAARRQWAQQHSRLVGTDRPAGLFLSSTSSRPRFRKRRRCCQEKGGGWEDRRKLRTLHLWTVRAVYVCSFGKR